MKNKTRKGFREWSNCSRRPARWRIKHEICFVLFFFFWQIQRKGSHCDGGPTQVKKERVSLWWVTYPSKKRKENEGSKAHSKGSEGSKACSRKSEGSKARSKGSEGSKVHSKWSEGSKARLKEVRARRRTQKRGRVRKRTTLDGQGLKGALERRWGLKGALKIMIEGSKAHLKGDKGLKAP